MRKRPRPWHTRTPFRLLWCLLGAASGIAIALALVGPAHHTFVLASLGGSSVFLLGLTQAPAAQPRAIFVGHFGGAVIGIACAKLLGAGLPAYAAAVSLTLGFMLLTRTVHPPAGANPVLMVFAQADWPHVLNPVLLGVATLMVVAFVWSRLYPDLQHYPKALWEPSPSVVTWGGWDDAPIPVPTGTPLRSAVKRTAGPGMKETQAVEVYDVRRPGEKHLVVPGAGDLAGEAK